MSIAVDDPGRIGQSKYWMYFGGNLVLAPALLIGGLYAMFSGSFGLGILSILLVLPLAIYFRVIMMRRCRDIGWPTFLPWLAIGFAVLMGFMSGSRMTANPAHLYSSLGLPMFVNALDFIFMITIGCISSKASYVDMLDDYIPPSRPSPAPLPRGYEGGGTAFAPTPARQPEPARISSQSDETPEFEEKVLDRWDAAIAARLAAHSGDAGAGAAPQPAQEQAPRPAEYRPAPAMHRPATGFGRKAV
jgi:uncharacterized membrane protein YhaH (DUF805 family)